jgi:hypothetical protein
MTKAEWISTIKHTLMKIDETGIYREPLLEKHIQSVYEQMYNEMYRRDKRGISKYTSVIEQAVADSSSIADGITLTTKPISLPRNNGGIFDVYIKESLFDDWYMPSLDETSALRGYFEDWGITNFNKDSNGENAVSFLWTSSEASSTTAQAYDIATGESAASLKTGYSDGSPREYGIIPVRSFTDADATYSVGDTGPAGGDIFLKSGTVAYETMKYHLGIVTPWSNVTNVEIGTTGTAVGTGAANTSAIIGQIGHISSTAKDADDFYVFYGDSPHQWVLTDYQNYKYALTSAFNTVGMMGKLYASVLGGDIYADDSVTAGVSYTLTIRMIPKFTSLSSTDEVIIPEGHEEMFIDRIIDTVKHMTPTDLINDNAIQ